MLLLLSLVLLQDDPSALIEQLRSESVEVRESASKRLKELGAAAKPALEKAAKDPDKEVATRASLLLRILQLKSELTPGLQQALPNVVDRLAGNSGPAWTEVFLDASAAEGEVKKHKSITRSDLEALVVPALVGAVTNLDKIKVCWMASNWRLKSAVPEMRKLTRDPDVEVRRMSLVWLSQLDGRGAGDAFAERLNDAHDSIRQLAASMLGSYGTPAHTAPLRKSLEDADERVRLNAAKSLGLLGDRSAVPLVVATLEEGGAHRGEAAIALAQLGEAPDKMALLLKDSDNDFRWYALVALEYVDARDQADAIAKFLEDAGPGAPGHAARVLGSWKLTRYADRIAELVRAKGPGNHSLAVSALGLMGDARHAKVLLPVLKDASNYMRANAAESLEQLDARDAAADIAALLEDKDAFARWNGVLSLGKLAARMPESESKRWVAAIRELEKDDSDAVRLAAAMSIVRLKAGGDEKALVRNLAGTWFESWKTLASECSRLLMEIHERPGYEKLRRAVELKRDVNSGESLAAVLKESGLTLLNPADVRVMGRYGKGRVISPLDIITSRIEEAGEPIVEKDTLRLMRREEALHYWMNRLK